MTLREYLVAWVDVLNWGCLDWHHPGDDECFAASGNERRDRAAWRLGVLLPTWTHGYLERRARWRDPAIYAVGIDVANGVDTAVLTRTEPDGHVTVIGVDRG